MINSLSAAYLIQSPTLQTSRPQVEDVQQTQNQQLQVQLPPVPARPLEPAQPQTGSQNNLQAQSQNQQPQTQVQTQVLTQAGKLTTERPRRTEEAFVPPEETRDAEGDRRTETRTSSTPSPQQPDVPAPTEPRVQAATTPPTSPNFVTQDQRIVGKVVNSIA